MNTEPTTQAGRDAVRMRGLFGGETFKRASAWVCLIEAEAREPLLRAASHAIAGSRGQHDDLGYMAALERAVREAKGEPR